MPIFIKSHHEIFIPVTVNPHEVFCVFYLILINNKILCCQTDFFFSSIVIAVGFGHLTLVFASHPLMW